MTNEVQNEKTNAAPGYGNMLFGRLDIYTTSEEITAENVVSEVNSAISYHLQNVMAEDYLYWYRRGLQPVLNREKERNAFITNKVVENHAEEIVTFKNGFFLQSPVFYVSRNAESKDKVDELNEYLYRSGKQACDNQLADWFHMVGKAALYVESADDAETPVKAYALDPRSAFVVYSLNPGNKPVFAVHMVINDGAVNIDVFTRDKIFRLAGSAYSEGVTAFKRYSATATSVRRIDKNTLGHIPIIEYRYNSVNMGAFESVISLLDAINDVQSNRVDGVAQFIQSLAVAVNCQFEEGTTAESIKKLGMIVLSSIGENKADFKILSEELNQDQTQTLVDNIYEQVLRICAMPSSTKGGSSTSDTGAAVLYRDGWEQAASAARNTEDLFRESNRYFDEIFLYILREKGLLDISKVDFDLGFSHNEMANVQSKAQAMQTMLAAGMHPILAFAKSGISDDPVSDVKMSEKYMQMIWGNPEAGTPGEAEIIESDNDNGESEV